MSSKVLHFPEGRNSRLAKATEAQLCGRMKDPKVHAAVARRKHVSNTAASEHFWKLSC